MAHHNYLIGHNTNPDRNKTNPSRLTALTPQNQPERPLLRGNHPYDQNAHADWFDAYYMFGVDGGFDVVIGNPPYVESRNSLLSDQF